MEYGAIDLHKKGKPDLDSAGGRCDRRPTDCDDLVRVQPEEPIFSRTQEFWTPDLSSDLHVALFRARFMRVFLRRSRAPGCSQWQPR